MTPNIGAALQAACWTCLIEYLPASEASIAYLRAHRRRAGRAPRVDQTQ
ncbi:hypothetical protein M8494_27115 [Serratia ureilytica]